MDNTHAEYAPSSMYLTVNCPGWIKQASLLPPEPPTEATLEGDAGHWVAAIAAIMAPNPLVLPPVGEVAPNGVAITEEMVDGAAVWVEALESYPARIEEPVVMLRLSPYGKCWGKPDARQWAPETSTLRVADYKFGYGFVDEFENWQMLAYMVGLIDELQLYARTDITLEMTVVQPRYYGADPIRTWRINITEIWLYVDRMKAAINEAEQPNPRTTSGTHCTYCPARVNCKTFGRTVMHAVDFTGIADPMVSTPEQIGRELKLVQEFIKRLEARETGLTAMAESMIRSGQRVPFYRLEQSVGRLAWTVPLETVEMTAQMSGKSALQEPRLITPTQARDRKILADTVVSEYSERPKGAMKLTQENTTKQARKFT